jgi:hypothetical protein
MMMMMMMVGCCGMRAHAQTECPMLHVPERHVVAVESLLESGSQSYKPCSTFERLESQDVESDLMLNLTRRRLSEKAVPTNDEILLISHHI